MPKLLLIFFLLFSYGHSLAQMTHHSENHQQFRGKENDDANDDDKDGDDGGDDGDDGDNSGDDGGDDGDSDSDDSDNDDSDGGDGDDDGSGNDSGEDSGSDDSSDNSGDDTNGDGNDEHDDKKDDDSGDDDSGGNDNDNSDKDDGNDSSGNDDNDNSDQDDQDDSEDDNGSKKDDSPDGKDSDDYEEHGFDDDHQYYVGTVSASDGNNLIVDGSSFKGDSPWLKVLNPGMLLEVYGKWEDNAFVVEDLEILMPARFAFYEGPGQLFGKGGTIKAWLNDKKQLSSFQSSSRVGTAITLIAYYDGTTLSATPDIFPVPQGLTVGWVELTGKQEGDTIIWESFKSFP